MRPTEAFFTYMKVSIVGGIILASPIILHQIWLFVKPALTVREKHLSNWILPVAFLLFVTGIFFSYILVLPAAVKFFMALPPMNCNLCFPLVNIWTLYWPLYYRSALYSNCHWSLSLWDILILITSQFLKKKRQNIYFAFLYYRCSNFTYTGIVFTNHDCIADDIII